MSSDRDRFPPQIKFIVGNEGCERFSFYGMRSILTVYMAQWLLLPEHEAEANYHFFVMACYLTPLAGGWLADRLWGRYRVIVWLSLGYVLGHATIAAFETRWGLFAGLTLIALGSGGIKPCVSAFVGDQFHPEQKKLLERVYGLFYWMINLGSSGSTLLIPVLLAAFGPRVAFAVPGLLMVAALALFLLGRRRYVHVPPTGPNPHAFTRVVASALRRRFGSVRPESFDSAQDRLRPAQPAVVEGRTWLDPARADHPVEAVEGARSVFRIMGVFAAVTAFWALFDQHGASWVLQARRMDLVVGGRTLQASQLAALNPLMVLLLIPLLQRVVFPGLELTTGEVLVSVTGLEFSYTQAPRSMKSTIMSIWLVTVALGNLLTAAVSALNRFQGASYFWFFAVLMLAGAIGFAFVARKYRPAAAAEPAAVL